MIETSHPQPITIGGREFVWGSRTYVMGVVNVTPDSFSGDGLARDVAAAVEQALLLTEAHGGEVTIISLGPERIEETIRKAMAKL